MPGAASRQNGKKGGRPKGKKSAATLEKEKVLAEVRQRIMRNAQLILDAQMSLARGQQFLYKIEKKKKIGPKGGVSYERQKPVLVTSEWEIREYLDGISEHGYANADNDQEATYYFITTKEPSNLALDSMLNRALGKPTESLELTGKDGGPISLSRLFEESQKGK